MGGSNMNDEMYEKALAGHVLEDVVVTDKVKVFYLKDPKQGRMMSTMIIFTPEGIALMGDLTPERHGSISSFGYGIGWFSGKLSADYLSEKFLEKKFVPEYAFKCIRERWQDSEEDSKERNRYAEVLENWFPDEDGPDQLYRTMIDCGLDCGDGVPGYTYEPGEQGWLCAIQQKFAELYNARQKENDKVG